ncbi:MAG: YihA family ribosome biogenesis GTP-binding protein [Deltaproteobacteria bacterium]|nr:YihA family ribosome biogenesis GTP-binding protein [Deltaproteobacteria bacterium]
MNASYPIREARFLVSAVRANQYPEPDRPEAAFAGRSNVGKSTLINNLLSRKNLARTSRTPGRTQTINFFDINREIYFVDLPGYGYAKVPVSVRAKWRPMVENYLASDRDLRTVVVIQDIRRDPGEEEMNLIAWLRYHHISPLVVITKTDKLSRPKQPRRITSISKALELTEPPLLFSGLSGKGRNEIWEKLLSYLGLE